MPENNEYLEHHGVKDQKWGVRRYQNLDGSLTELGRRRLGYGKRRKAKEGTKKKNLLSNPVKAAKKSGYLSTKDLKSAIEKAELANKLRELNSTAKEQARNAKLSAIERLSEVRQKAKLNKQEVKRQKEQAELSRQAAKAKEAENKGKASAEKWKNRATKLKNIVEVGKALKTLSDDAGITNKKSGETILGGILAGMGIKTLDKSKDKDDNTKDSSKSSNPVINITNIMPGGNQNASAAQSAAKTVAAAPISTAKSMNASSNGVFSFGAPNKASSVFGTSSFKDVDFTTIGGKAIPLFNWDDIDSSTSWDTVKARRKDGQPDKRYKALEYPTGSRWSDSLTNALIHGELSFDEMLSHMGYDYIEHHGIKNQKWGVRRYQNPDGSLTELGKRHYAIKSLRSENRQSRKELKRLKDEHFEGSFTSNLGRGVTSFAHPLRVYDANAVASMDYYRREREFENDPRTKAARSAIEKRKNEIKNLKISMKEIRRKGAKDNYTKPDATRVTDAEDNYAYYKKQYDEWSNSRKRYLSENPGEKFPEEHEVKWAKEAMDRAEKEYKLVRKLKKKDEAVS